MADSFQSLIEQAAGTQALAQSNTPSWTQNGNPNTVYNQTPPEGGYIPPRSNVMDDWAINKPRAYTPTDWSALTEDVEKSLIKPTWNIATSVPSPAQPGAPQQPQNPAAPQQPAAPAPQYVPVGDWFGSGKKDGGRSGPLSNQNLVQNNPAAKYAWDTVFGFHGGKFDKTSDWVAVQRHLEDEYRKAIAAGVPTSGPNQAAATAGGGGGAGRAQTASQSGGSSGTILGFGGAGSGIQSATGGAQGGNWSFSGGSGNYGGANTLYNMAPEVANKLGINPNGTIAWQQIADYLIPGNAYLSKTGEWDASNVVTAMLGEITGLPIDTILTKFGEQQAGQDDPQNFIERMLIDHYMDKLNNTLAGQMNMSQAEFKQNIAPLISQALADSVDISSLDIQNDAINSLLEKAKQKEAAKIASKTPSGGGGGGAGPNRGGNRGGGSTLLGQTSVPGAGVSRGGSRGAGTVTVGDLETVPTKPK